MGTKTTIHVCLLTIAGGLSAMAGCASDEGTDPGTEIPEERLLDDLDDGDGAIHEVDGRIGAWFVYSDESSTDLTPPTTGDFTPAADGENYYASLKGKGFTVWGAGMGFDIKNPGGEGNETGTKDPWDASAYTGIQFDAKGNAPLRLGVLVSAQVLVADGGSCTPELDDTGAEIEGKMCQDAHGKQVQLTGDWKTYQVKFADMTQQGHGFPTAFDATTVTGLQFDVSAGLDFEVGVDNLGFY